MRARAADLVEYQDAAYAERYRELVERVLTVEGESTPGESALSLSVARYAYKLMAYKDEYEVARLYSDLAFQRQLEDQFEGDYQLEFNLAPTPDRAARRREWATAQDDLRAPGC